MKNLKHKDEISCFFDGACEPVNPAGAMGVGACITFMSDGKETEFSEFVPPYRTNTNNIAEYMAFEAILDYLIANDYTDDYLITIKGDSRLVINQMSFLPTAWKIKDGYYKEIALRCKEKLKKFNKDFIFISWISGENNKRADFLSRQELIKNNIRFRSGQRPEYR